MNNLFKIGCLDKISSIKYNKKPEFHLTSFLVLKWFLFNISNNSKCNSLFAMSNAETSKFWIFIISFNNNWFNWFDINNRFVSFLDSFRIICNSVILICLFSNFRDFTFNVRCVAAESVLLFP